MFPQINDRFAAFIAPAKGQRSGWFLILGLCLIVIFYMEFMYLILGIAALVSAGTDGLTTSANNIIRMLATADTPGSMLLTLATFIGMFSAVVLTATVLRDRSPMTLIGPGPVLRNMAIAALALSAIAVTGTVLSHLYFDLTPNLPLGEWLIWLPAAIPLLFIQITAEEMIFRGYLQQELAARFNSPLIWMLVPSLVFGALHWDAETFGSNAWLIVLSTVIFGLFAADLTARTGNLGAAIGLHFANNFFALFVTALQGKMNGLSLYMSPFDASDHDAIRTLLILDICLVLTTYLIYLGVIRLKRLG